MIKKSTNYFKTFTILGLYYDGSNLLAWLKAYSNHFLLKDKIKNIFCKTLDIEDDFKVIRLIIQYLPGLTWSEYIDNA